MSATRKLAVAAIAALCCALSLPLWWSILGGNASAPGSLAPPEDDSRGRSERPASDLVALPSPVELPDEGQREQAAPGLTCTHWAPGPTVGPVKVEPSEGASLSLRVAGLSREVHWTAVILSSTGVPFDEADMEEALRTAYARGREANCAWVLRETIRVYGGQRLWRAAETAEQKRSLRSLAMDEDDLSEMLDAPLDEVRSW